MFWCIAPVYPALVLSPCNHPVMLLRLVFYTICKWWNKSSRNVGSMRRCGFKRSEIYEVQQFQFLFHHILQLPFHHILRHFHFSRALYRPDLELFSEFYDTLIFVTPPRRHFMFLPQVCSHQIKNTIKFQMDNLLSTLV